MWRNSSSKYRFTFNVHFGFCGSYLFISDMHLSIFFSVISMATDGFIGGHGMAESIHLFGWGIFQISANFPRSYFSFNSRGAGRTYYTTIPSRIPIKMHRRGRNEWLCQILCCTKANCLIRAPEPIESASVMQREKQFNVRVIAWFSSPMKKSIACNCWTWAIFSFSFPLLFPFLLFIFGFETSIVLSQS